MNYIGLGVAGVSFNSANQHFFWDSIHDKGTLATAAQMEACPPEVTLPSPAICLEEANRLFRIGKGTPKNSVFAICGRGSVFDYVTGDEAGGQSLIRYKAQ